MLVSADPLWLENQVSPVTSGFQVVCPWTFLHPAAPQPWTVSLPPPGVASKHELVRSLNGLFLVPSVQMSDPVSEKPDTIGGPLSPGLFSFVGKSWLFKADEDQASYPPADVGEVSRHLFCPHGLVLPESHTAEQKHNQEMQKNPPELKI